MNEIVECILCVRLYVHCDNITITAVADMMYARLCVVVGGGEGHHIGKWMLGCHRPRYFCADKPWSEHSAASAWILSLSHARRVAWH